MKKVTKIMPYKVPDNYFETLADQLTTSAMVANGAMNIASLDASIPMPFKIDKNYFENFGQQVMNEIKKMEQDTATFESTKREQMPFDLPANYFDTFADSVMAKINQTDEDLVDTTFIDDYKANVYEVPTGYFEQNKFDFKKVNTDNKQEPSNSNTKELYPNARRFRLNNWAVAASMLIIITLGGVMMNRSIDNGMSDSKVSRQLAQIPKSEIHKYLEENIDDLDLSLLEKSWSKHSNNNTSTQNSLLDNVSKKDIQEYLEEEGI